MDAAKTIVRVFFFIRVACAIYGPSSAVKLFFNPLKSNESFLVDCRGFHRTTFKMIIFIGLINDIGSTSSHFTGAVSLYGDHIFYNLILREQFLDWNGCFFTYTYNNQEPLKKSFAPKEGV